MTQTEALHLALEALEAHADIGIKSDKAITAIKAALEVPEEKYIYGTPLLDAMTQDYVPPQRTWVGLSDEERYDLLDQAYNPESYAVLVEAKLKKKNI
jgi:hypothetical protein